MNFVSKRSLYKITSDNLNDALIKCPFYNELHDFEQFLGVQALSNGIM